MAGARRGKAVGEADGVVVPSLSPAKGAKRRRYRSDYDLLREEPEARVDMSGHAQELSAVASEVVTDHADFEWGGGVSQRVWPQRRRAVMVYKHKRFTDNPNEAWHDARAYAALRVWLAVGVAQHGCVAGHQRMRGS